jgi:hypothetical protein
MEKQVEFPIKRGDLQSMMPTNPDEARKNIIVTLAKSIANAAVAAAREGRSSFMYSDQDRLREYGKELVDYLKYLLTDTYVTIITQSVNRLFLILDWSVDGSC